MNTTTYKKVVIIKSRPAFTEQEILAPANAVITTVMKDFIDLGEDEELVTIEVDGVPLTREDSEKLVRAKVR